MVCFQGNDLVGLVVRKQTCWKFEFLAFTEKDGAMTKLEMHGF